MFFMLQKSYNDRVGGPVHSSLHFFDKETYVKYRQLEFHHKFHFSWDKDYLTVSSSCDGIVCLNNSSSTVHGSEIFLWNPTIDRLVILPFTPSCFSPYRDHHLFFVGFGYDPKRKDYKVVRITYGDKRCPDYKDLPEVEVYSLRTRSWNRIINSSPPNYYVFGERHFPVYINGIVHWFVHYRDDDDICNSIVLWFDLSREIFGELMPESISKSLHSWNLFASITVIKRSLSFSYCDRRSKKCHIWIMKEYGTVKSWTRLFSIDFQGSSPFVYDLRNDGEMLLLSSNEYAIYTPQAMLASYNSLTEEVNYFEFNGLGSKIFLQPYTESLLLLDFRKAKSFDYALRQETKGNGSKGNDEAHNQGRIRCTSL